MAARSEKNTANKGAVSNSAGNKGAANKGALSYDEAIRQIGGGDIKPVYLLCGDEDYLQEKFIHLLKSAWLGDEAAGFGVDVEDGRAMTQTRAVDLVSQMTFFSDRKLVVIDEPAFIPCSKGQAKSQDEAQSQDAAGDVPPEEDGVFDEGSNTGAGGIELGNQQKKGRDAKNEDQPLLTYMGQPLSLSCLVLRCRSGKPDRRHKLTAEIVRLGGLVETTLRGPSERIPFLLEALAASGKQCGRGLLDQIARQPWSLTFCMRELDKTIAYAGGESTISQAMLDAVLTPSLESNIFRMVDALGARRRPDALRELRALLDSGESPFRIFPMMVRQYRLIFRAKACMVAGLRGGQIAQSLGVQPFIAQKSADQSRYYSTAELEEAMDLFCEKDLAMKSGIPPAQVLEDLVFELGK